MDAVVGGWLGETDARGMWLFCEVEARKPNAEVTGWWHVMVLVLGELQRCPEDVRAAGILYFVPTSAA